MKIEKRTLNWLPRPSLYKEAEAARLKRREHAQQAIANQQSIAHAFGSLYNVITQGEVDIAIRVAHARLVDKARTDRTA